VVAVVDDAIGQEGGVAPGRDDLLATVRGLPVHFDSQLVRPDDSFHRTVTVIQYRSVAQHAVGFRLPRVDEGVGVARRAMHNGPPDQVDVGTGLPHLRASAPDRHRQQNRPHRRAPHARKIGIILLVASGCHGNRVDVTPQPIATTVDKVWLLEASGTAVPDTDVTFAVTTGRTIVLRHARPDDAIFAVLQFPGAKDSLRARDSIHVTIHPTPGRYAFTLTTADKIASGAQATFSYAIHFQAPTDAKSTYPSPARLEAQLAPAELGPDTKVQFLAATRPAADMIRFPLLAAGTYALAAPR